ncbi:acyl-CoA dehydrogenase [Trinickia symbiotica]|uniref:Acyl-CoA dehydrogenase n=1 Tax=Trinickia symbiotica TaxID=863227 RepID=A0A2T3XKJ3_9BURK|nr:acyl-CoA dehydrogenase family protein [Trinickia symbiotica]PTB17046.1 acyl-CoA dehydrogenase [Trinickia symbiotica]
MYFELNAEQLALKDSLQRALRDRYGFEMRRGYAATEAGHDTVTWHNLAELGVLALPIPEACGGFSGGARDLFPIMQAFGEALSLEPFLASSVLGATAIQLADDTTMARDTLPGVAAGTTRLAWAHDEHAGRHAATWIETTANQKGGSWRLTGQKVNVLGGPTADKFVVSARTNGASGDSEGCALFLVDANASGLQKRDFRFIDETAASTLDLTDVAALPLGDHLDGARASLAIDRTIALGTAAVCADMLGAANAAFQLTVGYINTRKQFGRFIGENQALRHRAAEMLVSLELAKSMAIAAAVAVDDPASTDAALDLHRAKLSVGRHARIVAHGAIQLHGGIGMTQEYAVGHYLCRIHVLDQLFGDSDAHAGRLAALAGI